MATDNRHGNMAKAALWRGRLDERGRSGESIQGFCRRRGISEALYHYWKRRLAADGPAVFVEAQVVSKPELARAGRLVLRLAAGYEVAVEPGFDAATLQRLVAALAEAPC